MAAPLARFADTHDDNPCERRREPRYSTVFEAELQSSGGSKATVLIHDVSRHGCCIRSSSEWLRQGAFVSIGLNEEPMLGAVVRWIRDGAAGMEFLRPIPAEREEWLALLDPEF